MVYIESAEAKKELGRIDDILNEKHILIGGLAVKYFYPARESKDIDLVCSDAVRNTIIRELYPTNEWDIFGSVVILGGLIFVNFPLCIHLC